MLIPPFPSGFGFLDVNGTQFLNRESGKLISLVSSIEIILCVAGVNEVTAFNTDVFPEAVPPAIIMLSSYCIAIQRKAAISFEKQFIFGSIK